MTGEAKARRPRGTSETPDLTLVKPAAAGAAKKAAAEKAAPAKPANGAAEPVADSASAPVVTTEDPWRNLHPSRVWPD